MSLHELRLFTIIKLLEELHQENGQLAESIDVNTLCALGGISQEDLLKAVAGLSNDWHLLSRPQIRSDGSFDINLDPRDYAVSLEDIHHVIYR